MSTKRLFSLILAVAMLAAIVAGCTNQNGAPISSPPAEETAAPVQSEQPRAKSLSRFPLLAKVR